MGLGFKAVLAIYIMLAFTLWIVYGEKSAVWFLIGSFASLLAWHIK